MGVIRPGDEILHYSDSSHRWVSPDPQRWPDDVWRDRVQEHVDEHRRTFGRPRGHQPDRA